MQALARGGRWLGWGLVVVSPLLALLVSAASALISGHSAWLRLLIPTGRQAVLLARSLALGAGVALLDLVLGILIACACWGWGRRMAWLRWLPLVLLALPPYIHALTWSGALNQIALALGTAPPTGIWLAGWVMAMALLPVGIGVALLSLETVAPLWVDAARTSHNDTTVVFRVILPLATPLLTAGGALIFLLSLMDYSVPSLFGVNVYALEIFAEFSASREPVRAFLLAVPLLLVAGATLALAVGLLRPTAHVPIRHACPWSTPPKWSRGFALAQEVVLVIWSLQGLLPLAVQLHLTLEGQGLLASLRPAAREVGFSFGIAAAAALLSLPLAWLGVETQGRQVGVVLAFAMAAIPAPLVGIGLVTLWNRSGLDVLYATAWMPVLAALTRFAPLALLMLSAQQQRIDPSLWEAAQVFQRNPTQGTWRVRLPLLWPGLAAAASLVFALTLGELGATLIVAPPGQSTLTLRIYNYLHYGASDVVAGLCLVMSALTLAAGSASVLSLTSGLRRGGATR